MSEASSGARKWALSPATIVICGCLVSLITFGPRASAGLFQIPMTTEYGWTREVFSLALAIQNLLWGLGQPFSGALADRFGTVRVFFVGLAMYALGMWRWPTPRRRARCIWARAC